MQRNNVFHCEYLEYLNVCFFFGKMQREKSQHFNCYLLHFGLFKSKLLQSVIKRLQFFPLWMQQFFFTMYCSIKNRKCCNEGSFWFDPTTNNSTIVFSCCTFDSNSTHPAITPILKQLPKKFVFMHTYSLSYQCVRYTKPIKLCRTFDVKLSRLPNNIRKSQLQVSTCNSIQSSDKSAFPFIYLPWEISIFSSNKSRKRAWFKLQAVCICIWHVVKINEVTLASKLV